MTKAFQWAVPLCFAAATAWASPATTVGAKHLTEVFQTYFGTLPGVVAVVPQADTASGRIPVSTWSGPIRMPATRCRRRKGSGR